MSWWLKKCWGLLAIWNVKKKYSVSGSIQYQAKCFFHLARSFQPMLCWIWVQVQPSYYSFINCSVISANKPSGRVSSSTENRCLIQFSFVILSRKHSLKLVTKFRQCSFMAADSQDKFWINIKTFPWLKHLPISIMLSLHISHCILRCNFFIFSLFYILIFI